MPTQPIGDAVDVHIHTNTKVPSKLRCQIQCNINGEETYKFQAIRRVKKTILGPTPDSEYKSSAVFGTSEAKSSCSRLAICLMYLCVCKK